MDIFLDENFEIKPKASSEEELKRWRKLCGFVKNPKRRFRYTANLSKRAENVAIRRSYQIGLMATINFHLEKSRVAVLVSRAQGMSTSSKLANQNVGNSTGDSEFLTYGIRLYYFITISKLQGCFETVTRVMWSRTLWSLACFFGTMTRVILMWSRTLWSLVACFGTITRAMWSRTLGSMDFLKWMFILLNVVVEAWQAVLSQEAAQGKMNRELYLKRSTITSFVSLMVSLVEAFLEGRSRQTVWEREGRSCHIYYPSPQGQLLGSFLLYFGIACSMVQLVLNLIAQVTGMDFIMFDYVPLLLSISYLVEELLVASQEKTGLLAIVKCKTHGYTANEATTADLLDCPGCQKEE